MSFQALVVPVDHGVCFQQVIGTGGIGTGLVMCLNGNATLGRNESREAELLPNRDYCKQHIILHYIAVLGGPAIKASAIGLVGQDDAGSRVLAEMKRAGIDCTAVATDLQKPTLFSVCFQYPDSSGGNLTTGNSASSAVLPEYIEAALATLPGKVGQKRVFLTAPEVPLMARLHLLELGKAQGGLTVAALQSGEMADFRAAGGFCLVDILALNRDEALALTGQPESADIPAVVKACFELLKPYNPEISLTVTDGPHGVYAAKGQQICHLPGLKVPVASTQGAGDAFLGGLTAGLCFGLPFLKAGTDRAFAETPLSSAVELGLLVAALSVTSPDAIHPTLDAALLRQFITTQKFAVSAIFRELLGDKT